MLSVSQQVVSCNTHDVQSITVEYIIYYLIHCIYLVRKEGHVCSFFLFIHKEEYTSKEHDVSYIDYYGKKQMNPKNIHDNSPCNKVKKNLEFWLWCTIRILLIMRWWLLIVFKGKTIVCIHEELSYFIVMYLLMCTLFLPTFYRNTQKIIGSW